MNKALIPFLFNLIILILSAALFMGCKSSDETVISYKDYRTYLKQGEIREGTPSVGLSFRAS